MKNTLYYGDNLDVMRRHVDDESVDLIYLDPPFNSNINYNVLFEEKTGTKAAAQIKAFEDTWEWDTEAARYYQEVVEAGGPLSQLLQAFRQFLGESDMMAYLAVMAPRLQEMHRVLKSTGSIFLHCDPTASHYLKLLLDAVFGPQQFRNEIIWHYGGRGAKAIAKQLPRNHDVILWYSKDEGHTYERQYEEREFTPEQAKQVGFKQDPDGTWFKTAPRGDYTDISVAKLKKQNRIYITKTGSIRIKYFLETFGDKIIEKAMLGDVWSDIPDAMHIGGERLGYPTQKPVALLERIIRMACPEKGVVFDPFCGCGTAIEAAEHLKCKWIGIDITHLAIGLIKYRLEDAFPGRNIEKTYNVIGEPVSIPDAEQLARDDPYQFQFWALGKVYARPTEEKKGADKGIDGRLYFHDGDKQTKQIIISVKAGQNISVPVVRDLRGVVEREKADLGVIITMAAPTKQMRTEAAAAGFYVSPIGGKFQKLQILTIAEILDGKGIDYPTRSQRADLTFRRAKRRVTDQLQRLPFSALVKDDEP